MSKYIRLNTLYTMLADVVVSIFGIAVVLRNIYTLKHFALTNIDIIYFSYHPIKEKKTA